mmetsp:Transcript_13383/g.32782  ORF Transcript_13383/g.32782 Transcript_13383/m.32782 type:complete len:246 (+) Transcript_13383:974-1711(+)
MHLDLEHAPALVRAGDSAFPLRRFSCLSKVNSATGHPGFAAPKLLSLRHVTDQVGNVCGRRMPQLRRLGFEHPFLAGRPLLFVPVFFSKSFIHLETNRFAFTDHMSRTLGVLLPIPAPTSTATSSIALCDDAGFFHDSFCFLQHLSRFFQLRPHPVHRQPALEGNLVGAVQQRGYLEFVGFRVVRVFFGGAPLHLLVHKVEVLPGHGPRVQPGPEAVVQFPQLLAQSSMRLARSVELPAHSILVS